MTTLQKRPPQRPSQRQHLHFASISAERTLLFSFLLALLLLGALLSAGSAEAAPQTTTQATKATTQTTDTQATSASASKDAVAAPNDITLEMAQEAMKGGSLPQAIALHEELLRDHGPQADLYYNLGLLYEGTSDWTMASLNFERTLALEPSAEDAALHLQHSRETLSKELLNTSDGQENITEGEPRPVVWWRFFHAQDASLLGGLLLFAWLTAFALLIARRSNKNNALRDLFAVGSVVAFLVTVTLGGFLLGHWYTQDVRPAVITAPQTFLFEGPDRYAAKQTSRALYRGALVEVLTEREGWREVRLADGTSGWVLKAKVSEIRVDRWKPQS